MDEWMNSWMDEYLKLEKSFKFFYVQHAIPVGVCDGGDDDDGDDDDDDDNDNGDDDGDDDDGDDDVTMEMEESFGIEGVLFEAV